VWVAQQQAKEPIDVRLTHRLTPRPPIAWAALWWRTLIGGLVAGLAVQYWPREWGLVQTALVFAGAWLLTRRLPWLR